MRSRIQSHCSLSGMWTYWIPTAPPDTRLYKRRKARERILTVYALKSFDYFPKAHSLSVLCGKVRQDAGTQGDLLVKVALSKSVVAQFELRGVKILKICIEDAEGVKLRDVVSAHLVCTNEQLHLRGKLGFGLAKIICQGTNLEVIIKLGTTGCVERRCTVCRSRKELGWGLESIGSQALLQAREVGVPGRMDRRWVLPPMAVHLLCVVSVGTICKRIVGRRGGSWRGEVAVKETRTLRGDKRQPGPASCTSEASQGMPLQHGRCDARWSERTELSQHTQPGSIRPGRKMPRIVQCPVTRQEGITL